MGVNKNISILILFDCVRVNTGLGVFIESVKVKGGWGGGGGGGVGGGICELIMISMDSRKISAF